MMLWNFGNLQAEQKVWVKQYGKFKHFSNPKLPKGHGAKRKQKRKAQRAARKVKP